MIRLRTDPDHPMRHVTHRLPCTFMDLYWTLIDLMVLVDPQGIFAQDIFQTF